MPTSAMSPTKNAPGLPKLNRVAMSKRFTVGNVETFVFVVDDVPFRDATTLF